MMKLNDKAQRWLIVAGCGLLCTALISLIAARFIPQPQTDAASPASQEESREVNPVVELPEKQVEKEVALPVEPRPENQGGAAVSSGTEQTIQPDPVKPSEPEKPVAQGDITDPAQPPAYQPEDVSKPSKPSGPKHGDTSDGKIYVDGFGWIEDHGGGVSTTYDNEMYENGNKIGQMG